MARGSIQTRQTKTGPSYRVVLDLGPDPATGKRRQPVKNFKTRRDAQSYLTARLHDLERGIVVETVKQTVADLLRFWLETYARPRVSTKSYEGYEDVITRHLIPGLGHVQVQRLTPATVQAFYAQQRESGVSDWAIHYGHQRLAQALKQAVQLDIVPRNVCDRVTVPRVSHREMTPWSAEQVSAFLAVADQGTYGPVHLLALATGLRRGELLGLAWPDVDLEHGTVQVRQTLIRTRAGLVLKPKPKSASSRRTFRLPVEVVSALREHRARQNERRLALGAAWQDHGLVFSSETGTPINPSNLRRDFNALIKQAGVPTIRIHDARHTFATLTLASGAPLKEVSRRLGHSQASLTINVYAHALPEQDAEVATMVSALLKKKPAETVRDLSVTSDGTW